MNLLPHKNKEKLAIICEGQTISYGELKNRTLQYQNFLATVKESLVFVPMDDSPVAIYKLLACIKSEIPFIPINNTNSFSIAKELALDLPSSFLWDDEGYVFNTSRPLIDLPKETLFIGFTSGTTGKKKGFIRNKASWIHSFNSFNLIFPIKEYVTCLTPLHYSLGLYALLQTLYFNQTFLLGVTSLTSPLLNHSISNHLQCFSVPTVLSYVLNQLENQLTASFEVILGGELTTNAHRELFYSSCPNGTLHDYYGSSETSFISYNHSQKAKENCIGNCFPNVHVTLENVKNGIGEISVESPMNFQGYFIDGRIIQPPSVINTGDLGYLEDQLYFCGRKDTRINRKGVKIFPQLVENELLSYSEIKDVLAYSFKDATLGEGISVQVVWNTKSLSLSEINQRIASNLTHPFRIDQLHTVNEIKSGPSGKKFLPPKKEF